jgi:alpha-amylase
MRIYILLFAVMLTAGCANQSSAPTPISEAPFVWENANIYFLLTDRFNNGDPGNDINFDRTLKTAVNRGFQGGDILGITKKIEEGYFTELGITAIWMTPFVEQNHGIVDEGTGPTYGFHGYWAQDWTAMDPNFGTEAELEKLVSTAHEHGIRIIMDVVINHTGPATDIDPAWNDDWVRTSPACTYQDYLSTTSCTLVENLPDIKTESEKEVELPNELVNKWKEEGRYEQEMAELDEFFALTGYPRTPTYYIIKWLTDYVRKYGIDGYRLDTAKHVEESVWSKLRKEVDKAYKEWKAANPDKVLADIEFYMVGEVYGYGASSREYNFGDTLVDFYNEGINSMINFEFKYDAKNSYEEIFSKYSKILHGELSGLSTVNYLDSHDDGTPFDAYRKHPFSAATKLLLCPGAVQIYYGDESSRVLRTEGAQGDAHLRSFMNWSELDANIEIAGHRVNDVLLHWQKLGKFRKNHPSVGAGTHTMLSESPYTFKREYELGEYKDKIIVGLDLTPGLKSVSVANEFEEGELLYDAYSGKSAEVKDGIVKMNTAFDIILLFSE